MSLLGLTASEARALRVERGLTPTQAARALGFALSVVKDVEEFGTKHKPTADRWRAALEALPQAPRPPSPWERLDVLRRRRAELREQLERVEAQIEALLGEASA